MREDADRRRDDESKPAWEHYLLFRDLPADVRSLPRLAKLLGKLNVSGTWYRWMRDYEWHERANDWDSTRAAGIMHEERKAAVPGAPPPSAEVAALMDARANARDIGHAIQGACRVVLDRLIRTSATAVRQTSEVEGRQVVIQANLADVTAALAEARKHIAWSYQVPSEVSAQVMALLQRMPTEGDDNADVTSVLSRWLETQDDFVEAEFDQKTE